MLRWREEIVLLTEEMRRVVVFNRWKAGWWDRRVGARLNVGDDIAEGLTAIAVVSATRLREQATRLDAAWAPLVQVGQQLLADKQPEEDLNYELDADEDAFDDEPDEDDTIFDA